MRGQRRCRSSYLLSHEKGNFSSDYVAALCKSSSGDWSSFAALCIGLKTFFIKTTGYFSLTFLAWVQRSIENTFHPFHYDQNQCLGIESDEKYIKKPRLTLCRVTKVGIGSNQME